MVYFCRLENKRFWRYGTRKAILYHIKHDQRSVRSAAAIYEALIELIKHQPFTSIKVSELVEQAQVGRATFYRNFDMIEDVLRWRCDQVIDELMVYVAEYRQSQLDDSIFPFLKPVLRFFYLHSSIVELLIAAQRLDILQVTLQERLEKGRPTVIPAGLPAIYLDYGPVIRSSVAVHILAHWVQGGKQEPPDALADGLTQMASQMSGLGILI